jgi:hypothetical protein
MQKKLLSIFLPVVIAIACSFAVWANEPTAVQAPCDKCAKADKSAVAVDKDVKAAPGCDKCAKMKAGGKPCGDMGCDKNAKAGCEKCAKMKGAEGKPCGAAGCDRSAKDGNAAGCE